MSILEKEVYVGALTISKMTLPQLSKKLACDRDVAFIIRGQAHTIVRLYKMLEVRKTEEAA
jgi:hypothetical protein